MHVLLCNKKFSFTSIYYLFSCKMTKATCAGCKVKKFSKELITLTNAKKKIMEDLGMILADSGRICRRCSSKVAKQMKILPQNIRSEQPKLGMYT